MDKCSKKNCSKKIQARKLCKYHYEKWRKDKIFGNSKLCSVSGCGKKHLAGGLCHNHYHSRIKKTILSTSRICEVKDCGRKAMADGLCNTHYNYMRRRPNSRDKLKKILPFQPRFCSVGGCNNEYEAKGFCRFHYISSPEQRKKQKEKRSDPIGKIKIQAAQKKFKQSEKGKEWERNYRRTPERIAYKRAHAQRQDQREKRNARKKTIEFKERERLRRKTDINYRLAINLRNRISIVIRQRFKNKKKGGSAVKDLGCSIEEFKLFIEGRWQEGMNWENYGKSGWHIDHRTPLSAFNLEDRNDFLKACHYTNLQPLWAADNLLKAWKINKKED